MSRWAALDVPLGDDGLRALYEAADPHMWLGAARDYRALPVAEAAARHGRDATRQVLGMASMTSVDRLVAAARDVRADSARHALALAMRPVIQRAALIAAAPGWRIEPESGMVYRLYDQDGQDVTGNPCVAGRYRRAVRVDLGIYMYGAADLRLEAEQGFVVHGETDNPTEALRMVLAEPLPISDHSHGCEDGTTQY
ncbi:hypothetical protein FDG2_2770 [Candidatus Protofrankia californiensis]|uniref:Uncharacterized protein n=1 Tax=Candidatus Protofrankia californiensis TaxID=1839754 RepID=A0A1C3NY99_9ACTN|nr:hypothetical protein FDG2_2770 [Candidatus Protofrankia californiensis]